MEHGFIIPSFGQPSSYYHASEGAFGILALDVRVVAIAVVLLAALIGSLPPILCSYFQDAESLASQFVRAVGVGVMLSLALVHVAGDAIAQLQDLSRYPVAGVLMLAGLLCMIVLEIVFHQLSCEVPCLLRCNHVAPGLEADTHRHEPSSSMTCCYSELDAHLRRSADFLDCPADHDYTACPRSGSYSELRDSRVQHGFSHSSNCHGCEVNESASPIFRAAGLPVGAAVHSMSEPFLNSSRVLECTPLPADDSCMLMHSHANSSSVQLGMQHVAYLMELGCVFHSIVIGVDLGINKENQAIVLGLMVALSFHQLLEGLGLGAVVKAAGFSLKKSVVMVVLYAMTTPCGIVVGIVVSGTYSPSSKTALLACGILNSVSAGILLYTSFIQLASFQYVGLTGQSMGQNIAKFAISMAGIVLGSVCMCLLAIWA